jgi:hypothetical protein
VVQADQHRVIRGVVQRRSEKVDAPGAEFAMSRARHDAVEHDQADVADIGGVVHELGIVRDAGKVAEGAAESRAPIVVADADMERAGQAAVDDFAEDRVFVGAAGFGDVAGDDHGVRRRFHRGERRDRAFGHRIGLDHAIGGLAMRTDVQIRQMSDQHRRVLAVMTVCQGTRRVTRLPRAAPRSAVARPRPR